jgi:ABC-2 type transport system permease protein
VKLRRMSAIARKETRHVLRDPRSLGMGLAMPAFLMILFGYALSLDVEHIPLGVLDRSSTPESRELTAMFSATRAFTLVSALPSIEALESALDRQDVLAVLVIPGDFADSVVAGGDTAVQLIVDGSDSRSARAAMIDAQAVVRGYRGAVAGRLGAASVAQPPIALSIRAWYNPSLESRNAIVPGLTAVVMMVIAAMLTALTVAREWEAGTMEQLVSTPVRRSELMLGKLFPYVVMAILDVIVAVVLSRFVFGVPLRGSLLLLALAVLVFLTGTQTMGLAIGIITRSQLLASQIAIVTTFLPAFLLSGFVYDTGNMPVVVRAISHVVPARYLVSILKSIYLKGGGFAVVAADLAFLSAFAVVAMVIAHSSLRLGLDAGRRHGR